MTTSFRLQGLFVCFENIAEARGRLSREPLVQTVSVFYLKMLRSRRTLFSREEGSASELWCVRSVKQYCLGTRRSQSVPEGAGSVH